MPHPKVKIADNGGNEVGVTDNRLNVNVAGATMSTGDIEVNSEFPAAATITDNFANPSTTSVMSMGMAWDGAAWDRLLGDSTNGLLVDLGSNNDVTVTNDTAGNLLATVTQDSAARTVTGTVGHDITGIVSDRDVDVGTTAEKIYTASDVAIKRIDIQAAPANTGYIFVGDGGVAGDGTGGGIRLAAGDFYSLDIDNTGDVYVAASEANEDVYYTYYT